MVKWTKISPFYRTSSPIGAAAQKVCSFSGGVSYEEMNFALLIPMPEVNKKHTRMTKHRDLK